jgi:hypothetical protein
MGVFNYVQAGRAAAVTPSDTENIPSVSGGTNEGGCILYIGSGGTSMVRVLTIGGDDVTFSGVQPGTILQVRVVRVFQGGTTANNILALW